VNDRIETLRRMAVSRETEARLVIYVELLQRWQKVKNLVGVSTLEQIWSRHIADSAQLLELAPAARSFIDMGSGAGLPGLILAICLAEREGQVHLIEKDPRKAAFLREAARQTGAPAQIYCGRIETILPAIPMVVDVITARALAPLCELIELGRVQLEKGAMGLFPKGQHVDRELTCTTKYSKLRFELEPSKTHIHGRIVRVTCCDRPVHP
jgi:16S rRNA (guanine527-N7)-methyltransferase